MSMETRSQLFFLDDANGGSDMESNDSNGGPDKENEPVLQPVRHRRPFKRHKKQKNISTEERDTRKRRERDARVTELRSSGRARRQKVSMAWLMRSAYWKTPGHHLHLEHKVGTATGVSMQPVLAQRAMMICGCARAGSLQTMRSSIRRQ